MTAIDHKQTESKFPCPELEKTLSRYGKRTTLHGIAQCSNSPSKARRILWIAITLIGTAFCLYHIHLSVDNFITSPISSSYFRDSSEAEFPDVTICNLKPVSESILKIYKELLFKHFDEEWDFFQNWNSSERYRRDGENRKDYIIRLKNLFRKYMEIFWASDDSRDFGMLDSIFIRNCVYDGEPCGDKDFKLVQHSRFWNCYTFKPRDRRVRSNGIYSGLRLIMYTDSITDIHAPDSISYLRHKTKENEMTEPYTFEEYLRSGRSINEVITGQDFLSSGIRVFLHDSSNFPSLTTLSFDIPNGVESTIKFSQINYDAINSKKSPCMEEDNPKSKETVDYVNYFGVSSTRVGRKTYRITDLEYTVNLKQKLIFEKCGCYSHRFPFPYNTSLLCYFAKEKYWKHPPDYILTQISCHDNLFKYVEVRSIDFTNEADRFHPCKNRHYTAVRTDTTWPKDDDMYAFVNTFLIPSLIDGKELSKEDKHPHHLLKDASENEVSMTRERTVLSSLLHQNCRNITNKTYDNFWCTNISHIRRNHIKIIVQPETTHASVYYEQTTYEWPEILSEIGGTLGLWMGMSILSFIELVELIIYCCFPVRHKKRGMLSRSSTVNDNADTLLAIPAAQAKSNQL